MGPKIRPKHDFWAILAQDLAGPGQAGPEAAGDLAGAISRARRGVRGSLIAHRKALPIWKLLCNGFCWLKIQGFRENCKLLVFCTPPTSYYYYVSQTGQHACTQQW